MRNTKKQNFYIRFLKPLIGRTVAFIGLLLLWWLYVLIAIAIVIDDPGPVLFKQRRVGKKKNGELTYFQILKFRTMKVSTPRDVPTHLLHNPDQYITRVGRILRKYSLDEIPQLWNIAIEGNLLWIGPRPALYNQEDLIQEREKYGANDVMPGITGWAQVNGRDELEIEEKARLDGVYTSDISRGNVLAMLMDLTCLIKTVKVVICSDGINEGDNSPVRKKKRRLFFSRQRESKKE